MLLEIKKEKNKYVLLNPPPKAGSHFYIEVDSMQITTEKKTKMDTVNKVYKEVKNLVSKYPENEFLQISLRLTPPDYEFGADLTDEILLNEALSKKYGI